MTHCQTGKVHVQGRGASQLANLLSALAKHPSHQQWNVSDHKPPEAERLPAQKQSHISHSRVLLFSTWFMIFFIPTFRASVGLYRCLAGLLPSLLDLLPCAPWTSLPGGVSQHRMSCIFLEPGSSVTCWPTNLSVRGVDPYSIVDPDGGESVNWDCAARRVAKRLRALLASKTV